MDVASDLGMRDADRVYANLRQRILSLGLVPGSVLDEAGISSDLGTSRTPVREAVIRLVSEGLLKREGRQIIVPTFQVGELRAFFEAMTLLARATHRMAAERRTDGDLAGIEAACLAFEAEARGGDEVLMNEANHSFHLAISRAADNLFLREAYEAIMLQSLRLSRHCFVAGSLSEYTHREHMDRIVRDHRELCGAIRDRDPARADRIASGHVDLFRVWLSKQLLGPSSLALEFEITSPELPATTPQKGSAPEKLIAVWAGAIQLAWREKRHPGKLDCGMSTAVASETGFLLGLVPAIRWGASDPDRTTRCRW